MRSTSVLQGKSTSLCHPKTPHGLTEACYQDLRVQQALPVGLTPSLQ
ncbi:hypothetical protein MGSAQ_002261 [marine sediment metagenome]|uniref:Uncharacterized protein n=1 Tax=marine sediment metagenome TaxID=412755 RepID=A0A1B6NS92_9ZZZZ